MRKTITKGALALALAIPVYASAQSSPTFDWAQQVGRPVTPCNNTSFASTVDAAGNVYTTGRFQDTTDFDPGTGVSNRTSAGAEDYFRLTLNPSGNFLSATSGGGAGAELGTAIATDHSDKYNGHCG